MTTIKPIINQHYNAVFNALQSECAICKAPKTQAIVTPMSWLHLSSEPFINVLCMPACAKPACDTKTRQNVQVLMAEMNGVTVPARVGQNRPDNTNGI